MNLTVQVSSRTSASLRCRDLDPNTNNSKKAERDIHEPSSPSTEHSLVRACSKGKVLRNLPPISDTLMRRRLQFTGHCLRAEMEIISSLLLWNQRLTIRNRKTTYAQTLSRDSGIEVGELGQAMRYRTLWHAFAGIPASDAEG